MRRSVIQSRAIQSKTIAAQLLRPEQRNVGCAEQALGRVGMVRIQARADARTGRKHTAIDRKWLLQSRDDLRGLGLDFLDRLHILQQHREFIAAETGEHAIVADRRVQAIGDALQHAVPEVVAQRVVDRFEVVHVQEQQRESLSGGGGSTQRAAKMRGKLAAVRKLGQGVMVGQMV